MLRVILRRCAALAACALSTTPTWSQESADSFADALSNGSFDFGLRYRLETVDQQGIAEDAIASTLRTRLTYSSAPFRDYSILLEMDDLRIVGPDDFNSSRNGKSTYPLVVDPEGTDLNQARVRYTGIADTTITFGRQRINHTNQRFIGGVVWRQNEQTYDALELTHTVSDTLRMRYTYLDNVNRIQGPSSGSPPADFRSSSHLVDADYDLSADVSITGYGYFLDFDNAPGASSQTIGLRLTGMGAVGEGVTLPYVAEFARQNDYGNNPTGYDANYYLLEAGLAWSNLGIKAGYEVLEGDGIAGRAFRTPLATGHAFQGWADKFLTTPASGIEDTYVALTGRAGRVNFAAIYHDFAANSGSASYGDEIDLQAGWAFADNYSVLLKLASYSADAHASDTDKFWVMLSASF